jgi:uncharacterized membrane protein
MTLFWLVLLALIVALFFKTEKIKYQFMAKLESLEQSLQQAQTRLNNLERKSPPEDAEEMAFEAKPPPYETEATAEVVFDLKLPDEEPAPEPGTGPEPEPSPHSVSPSPFPPQPIRQHEAETPEPAALLPDSPSGRKASARIGLAEKWKTIKENVDWEMFTGTKLFAWLGGVALFIGAGFFVKYSIDRNLIPPIVRLVIAAVAGIGLIIASFRFKRDRFDVMRHTLGAGGIGVLYSVIFAATLYYQYIPKSIGFFCLTVISAAAFVLAVHHRGIAISVLGAIGAYFTPILVNTGSGNLALLFVYLSIVNVGLYQVIVRLKSTLLLLIATAGTLIPLYLGAFYGGQVPSANIVAWVWVANLALFSAFFLRIDEKPAADRFLLWSGITLYAAVLVMALALTLNRPGCAPMILLTTAVSGAVGLSLNRTGWVNLVLPYAVCTFIASFLWTWLRFRPDSGAWYFLLFFLYGVAGGMGPVLLIRKYGIKSSFINWFKIFPVAIAGLSLVILLKNPQISFWFWPMIICLQIIGIIASLLVGAIFQIGILTVFLIISGLAWLQKMPTGFVGLGFYGFILTAGAVLCVTTFLVMLKLPQWVSYLRLEQEDRIGDKTVTTGLTEWMAATPVIGGFVLLTAAFIAQQPVNPHPGMATLVCLLTLALVICRRIAFQPIGMVALVSAVVAQAAWMIHPGNDALALHFSTLAWASALFAGALMIPFLLYAPLEKWKNIWMVWAFFEICQGLFIIWGADHLWEREISGWLPMVLAVLKLPVVAVLLRRLQGKTERNAILAWHGGVLLFYVSAVPIMLLDQGWIGLTLVFEASALLWLNRRIEHPGLRRVAMAMAPVGLFLLWTYLPRMKGPDSLMILNAPVLATAACVAALFFAVRLSAFPGRMLGKIDLPVYFLWLAVGTGFYLVNLLVADIFGAPGTGYDLLPKFYFKTSLVRSICSSLIWAGFGAVLWRVKGIPAKMRWAGIIILCLGAGWLLSFPLFQARAIAHMRPLLNLGLPAYPPLMIILFYLYLKEPAAAYPLNMKNLFLALFLIAGFMFLAMEKSTLLQPGDSFTMVFHRTLSMAVSSAAGWILYGLGMLMWPRHLDRPFRLAGLVLLLLGFVKAVLLPFQFRAAFGVLTPILNGPTFLYAGCLALLIFLIRRGDDENWPVTFIPGRVCWVVVFMLMAFYVLNVEIASAFGIRGRPFSLRTHGSLSHQLGYSLGWLVFSIGMLASGIKWRVVRLRWAALILLVLTTLKIFFKDLWALGQLYRVASFIGLAAVLILVSFLYQRYLSDGSKNAEET